MSTPSIPATVRVPNFIGQGRITSYEKPVPQPGPDQLLIQVKANALCGSERGQFFDGTPVTPGHEASGIVVAAGEGTTVLPGTPGVIFLMDFCGTCRSCSLGFTNQCLNKRGDMGFNRDGGYGIYELVHENIFFPIDPDLSLTEATLLLDIMGTGGHALRRAQLVRPDIESLFVAGAGPIGLSVLAMAKLMLAADIPVYISDVSDYRLQLAEQLGGIPVQLKKQSARDLLQQRGLASVDAAFDSSGKTVARRGSIDLLGQRGVLVCIGHGEELPLTVSPDLIATERAVLGSEYFAYRELQDNLVLLRAHRAYLNKIITHRFGVQDIQQAFELFFQGQTGKVVIEQ